jgi:hypothetical protein
MMLNASSKYHRYTDHPDMYATYIKPGTTTLKARCTHGDSSTICVLCFPHMFCNCSGRPERNSICPGRQYKTQYGLEALQGCQIHDNVSICAHPDLFTCFDTMQNCVVCQKGKETKTAGKTHAVLAACGPAVEGFFDRYIANSTATGKLGRVPIQDRTQQQEYYFATTKHLAKVLAEVYARHPQGLTDEQALEKACEIAKTPQFVATHNKNLDRKETKASKALKAMAQAAAQPALVGGAGPAGSAGSAGASGSAGGAGNFMPAPAPVQAQLANEQAVENASAVPVDNVDSLVAAGYTVVQAISIPPAPVVTSVAAPVQAQPAKYPAKRPANASNIAQPALKRQALPVVTAFQVPAGASVANSFASVLGRPVAVATQAPILQAVPYVPAPVAAPAQAPAQAPVAAPVSAPAPAPVVTSVVAPAPAPVVTSVVAPAPAPVVTSVAAPAPAQALTSEELLAIEILAGLGV